jgi:hypothetical protein
MRRQKSRGRTDRTPIPKFASWVAIAGIGTEKAISYRDGLDAEFRSSTTITRTLTYH